jgi:hypothetical protein
VDLGAVFSISAFAENSKLYYVVHMKKISIRELHPNTGSWVRRIGTGEKIVITDRGNPVAMLGSRHPFQS